MKKTFAKVLEIVAWSVAGVVLCGACAYYNFIDKVSVGANVGDYCPDFKVKYIQLEDDTFKESDETFTLSANNGKITILNFWDTWCTACVQELPDFNQFKAEYPQVDVIAVVPERADVIPWMNRKDYQKNTPGVDWTEWVISFTMYNAEESDLYALLGGKGALPMTVIVDGTGVIVFNKEGSMHLKDLKEIVEPLIND